MAKRQNRLAPIQHEIRQLIALKTLEPNATPPEARRLLTGHEIARWCYNNGCE